MPLSYHLSYSFAGLYRQGRPHHLHQRQTPSWLQCARAEGETLPRPILRALFLSLSLSLFLYLSLSLALLSAPPPSRVLYLVYSWLGQTPSWQQCVRADSRARRGSGNACTCRLLSAAYRFVCRVCLWLGCAPCLPMCISMSLDLYVYVSWSICLYLSIYMSISLTRTHIALCI